MIDLFIIADDITGAIDTGVQLTKQGIATLVFGRSFTNIQDDMSKFPKTSVVVVNTESRHNKAEDAAEKVREAVIIGQRLGARRFYKKTDSTLRGNIGSELQAFLQTTKQSCLPFVPAHPILKRFTKKGFHYLNDELLENTVFGKDPLEPIKESYVPSIIESQSEVHMSVQAAGKMEYTQSDKEEILLFDCSSLDELDLIANYIFKHKLDAAIAGSAAICDRLPSYVDFERSEAKKLIPNGPCLLLNGSLNAMSRNQVLHLVENGVAHAQIPTEIFEKSYEDFEEWMQTLLAGIASSQKSNQHFILSSTPLDMSEKAETHPILQKDHQEVAQSIGRMAARIVESLEIQIIVVIGGDTLMGLIEALSIDVMIPQNEILPGVAVSLGKMEERELIIISKPGGYGNSDTLELLLSKLSSK